MQRLISKYGLAAHLAILAVAPLFLFSFCDDQWVSRVLLWLSLFAGIWMLMAPSCRRDEMLHEARIRVIRAMIHDPLLWVMLAVVLFAFFCALNTGVRMAYDAEAAAWSLTAPKVSFFPGCLEDHGFLPLATSVAALVLVQGCRRALGKSARQAFAYVASCLAGLAALVTTVYALCTDRQLFVSESLTFFNPAFAGMSFGIYFLASLVALVGAFELKWKLATPFVLLAIGGTAIGLFHFASAIVVTGFVVAAFVLLSGALVYVEVKQGGTIVPKCLVLLIIALLIPVFFVIGFTPTELLSARLDAALEGAFFPQEFVPVRDALSGIAEKVWRAYPWRGTGIGSFGLDIRFTATPADWALFKPGQNSAVNGWWQLLAERGIVGTMLLALPFLLLLWSWVARLGGAIGRLLTGRSLRHWLVLIHPLGALGLIAFLIMVAAGLIERSFERPETMLAVISFFALAGSSFPSAATSSPSREEEKEKR